MSQSIDLRMLDALEIFHYSYRFQNRLFILVLTEPVDLRDIITDLRVLHSAHIQTLVVCPDHAKLLNLLQVWNHRGCPFQYLSKPPAASLTAADIQAVKTSLDAGTIPVFSLSTAAGSKIDAAQLDRFAMHLAACLTVDKVFFLSTESGLMIDDRFLSHTTPHELQELLKAERTVNIGKDRLRFLIEESRAQGCDIVLLEGRSGCLFQEIFTHRGIGTLLTSSYPNTIRKAALADVMDISLLMKPYVRSGAILPVPEDDLAAEIDSYFVYTVNQSIVAAAKLSEYGDAAELAKFCTLPRYQGKGRAHELALQLIDTATRNGKRSIFALSVEPRMFDFFRNLGFEACCRKELPESWLKNYDLSRPSKAFRLVIPSNPPEKD